MQLSKGSPSGLYSDYDIALEVYLKVHIKFVEFTVALRAEEKVDSLKVAKIDINKKFIHDVRPNWVFFTV